MGMQGIGAGLNQAGGGHMQPRQQSGQVMGATDEQQNPLQALFGRLFKGGNQVYNPGGAPPGSMQGALGPIGQQSNSAAPYVGPYA